MIKQYVQELPHGIRLSCRSAGEIGRPVLVFLHGFPEAAFIWDDMLRHFARPQNGGFRCVAPNLRGFEQSSAPPDVSAYRPKHLVQDIAALLAIEGGQTQLGAAPGEASPLKEQQLAQSKGRGGPQIECLVAHDWGGAVAWSLAAQQPDLMKKLAIINSPHAGTFLRELQHSPSQQAASAYMNFLIRPDAEKLLSEDDFRRLFEFFMPSATDKKSLGPRTPPHWLTEALRAQYRDVWQRGLTGPLNFYRASPLRPGPDIAKVAIPRELLDVRLSTLVLWAMADIALPPALLTGLADYVPHMELKKIEGAGHWIIHEQPALVAQHLRDFLAS